MMNTMFAISGFGGIVIGATLMNYRWRRIEEDCNWDAARSSAFQVRELHLLADRETRKRQKAEAEAKKAVAEAKEWVGDLLTRVNRQATIIEQTRNRKVQKLVRLSKGWRVLATEKIAHIIKLWPGWSTNMTAAWDDWPTYGRAA